MRVVELEAEPGGVELFVAEPLDLLKEGLDQHTGPRGHGRAPREPRRAIGDLSRSLRAGALGLGGEVTGLHKRAHVMEHRAGIDVEQLGELLVGARLERAQPQHPQPQR